MDAETAQLTLTFLGRTDLKGAEMPALAQCVRALNEIIARDQAQKGASAAVQTLADAPPSPPETASPNAPADVPQPHEHAGKPNGKAPAARR